VFGSIGPSVRIDFNHDDPNLVGHTGEGHDLGFGAQVAF